MLYRDWMLALGALLFALPNVAFAASFGTRTAAGISPFEGGAGVVVTNVLTDVRPTTTWAWLADGSNSAAAGAPFGSNHAEAFSSPGFAAQAVSMWSETYTITSRSGATGSAAVSFEFLFAGFLDSGASLGGSAQMTLRVLTGTGEDAADSLLPGAVVDRASVSFTETCREADLPCSSGPVATGGGLVLETVFQYGAPFRFAMLLEAGAAGGGRADFAPSAWLERIQLPDGAVLRAASGWDYEDLAAVVPEPGTLWLLALGLAAFGGHGASRESRS